MTEAEIEGVWPARVLLAVLLLQAFGLGIAAAGPETAPVAGTIRVVPDAGMALTDWNALLHVLQLRVVGGPDRMGAYTVAPMNSASTTRHTLQRLRAIRGVRWAQPVAQTP